MINLRPYQYEAAERVHQSHIEGDRPAVVLPTGTGKTVIFASKAVADVDVHGKTTLILAHREELIDQTMTKIKIAGFKDPGRVQAGHDHVERAITVGSVQTLVRRLDRINSYDHVVVDEAHHAVADSYLSILKHLGALDGRSTLTGYTATLLREDRRKLGDIFTTVAYTMPIRSAILAGHLVNPRGYEVVVSDLDLTRRSGRDYSDKALGRAISASSLGPIVAKAYSERGRRDDGTLRPAIAFTPTVGTAYQLAVALEEAGVRTDVVVGDTPTQERHGIYNALKRGETDCIVSVMVLTEGFDLPEAEVAIIARPTQSRPLYVQMVGRVLRPAPWSGKTDALVLDVTDGRNETHSLGSLIDLSTTQPRTKSGGQLIDITDPPSAGGAEPGDGDDISPDDVEIVEKTLFESSSQAWLQTPAGVWFIPTRDHFVFLWPTDFSAMEVGEWRIGIRTVKKRGGQWHPDTWAMADAMMVAEAEAMTLDSSIASRRAPWRRRRPSSAMISFAASFGIREIPDDIRAGELSNMISTVQATRLFDRAYEAAREKSSH